MQHRKLLDKAIVAALLLAYVPYLTEAPTPVSCIADSTHSPALIAPAPPSTDDDNPASGL